MDSKEFIKKASGIDNERFKELIKCCNIKDSCLECGYFTEGERYRCFTTPACIGATLSTRVNSYLKWKTGLITEKQHNLNLGI